MLSCLSTFRDRALSLFAVSALAVSALGVSTTRATASDDRLLPLLLGAAAVAIMATSTSRAHGRVHHAPVSRAPRHCRKTLHKRGRPVTVYHARCLHHSGLRALPDQCHEVIRINQGRHAVYHARCLDRFFAKVDSPLRATALPDRCMARYHHRGQKHRAYSARCLHHAGLRNLPVACLVTTQTGQVYAAHCLYRHGDLHPHGYGRR